MINNNMKMIKQLNNIRDYDEYVDLCEENSVQPNDLNRYCSGIGMLSIAIYKYPDLEWQEAYKKIIEDINSSGEKGKNGCCQGAKEKPVIVEESVIDEKPLGMIATGKNLIKSTKEHMSKGMSHVDPDEYIRRLTICKDCEWIKEGFQCGQCHCFMGIKAGWDIEGSCKLKKW